MAPKRKKKDTGGAKSAQPAAAAAAAKKADADDNDDPLATLLTNIQQISKDGNRCTDLLQAFTDGKCTVVEGNKEEHVDCYWILLTTHWIQRMVQRLEKSKGDENVTIVLSALCHALATTLYVDKSKLERSASKTGPVRSALGRAMMGITIGSTCALQNLGECSADVESSLIRRAAWSAATALDMVVNHSAPKATTASGDGWNHAHHWLLHDAANLDLEHEVGLAEVCQAASNSLGISKEEHACLAALLGNEAPPTPSGKRRRAARKDDAPPSTIATQFRTLMETQLATMIDGRVSQRRWASMTFVWFCQGQQRLLEFVDALLTNYGYWNSALDCPAVVGRKDAPPKKASTASKRGSRANKQAEAAEAAKRSPPVYIPGNVSVVALASRLISIVSETGTNCGVRAPSGGMDTYAARVLGLTGTGKGRGRAAESIPSWKRPDVRNLASVVIHKLTQSHAACLRKNCTSPEAFGCVLVNDDTGGFGASVPTGATRPLQARFYPAVHKSLNSLCYAAASSGHESTHVGDSTKRLLGIASAFILASGEQVRNIMDAKLYGVAVGQLTDCLRNITSDDGRTTAPRGAMEVDAEEDEESRHARLIEKYSLVEPLPVPTLSPAKASRKRKKKKSDSSQESSVCTYGGVFSQENANTMQQHQNLSDEELLSFLIRAVQSAGDESPPSAMFTELIEIIRCCYNLREPAYEGSAVVATVGGLKRKGKKRGATTKSSQGKRKRKKVSAEASEVSRNDDNEGANSSQRAAKNMKSARAGLATDSLNAIRMMLTHIPATSSASHSRRELREFFRETLTTDHICGIVDLNRMINEALMESHVAMKAAQKKPVGDDATSTFFSASQSGNFRPYEKLVWTAHINLCQTIGRGQSIYDANKKGMLGDANQILTIFQAVAVSSKREVSVGTATKTSRSPERWPLSLPAAQHALVASSLASKPIEGQVDFDPERFIVQSFVASIKDALDNPSLLRTVEWHKSSFGFNDTQSVIDDDDVPLSLRDARLFVFAVTRLPKNEQMQFLNNFVGVVSSAVDALKSSDSHCALIGEDADVSGFLGRVVTVCAALTNFVTVGPKLRDALVAQVDPSHHAYSMPNLVATEEMTPQRRLKDFEWYRKETSYISLFADWESPVVPDVAGPLQLNAVPDELASKLRVLHEAAIQLGFRSAKVDRCHLLFSAWNASGRSSSWEKKPGNITTGDTSASDEESASRRLLDLRGDICELHREIHGNESLFSNSLLTRIMTEQAEGRSVTGQLKTKLESMMAKAEAIVDSILTTHSAVGGSNDISMASFALLEALPAYIAFIMSAHTRSTDNILSRASAGGNDMSDGESMSSVEDYPEEDRLDILARLNDACIAFGAAPAHPDWLDVGCFLREGITVDDATRLAHRAMKCLERLLSAAREAYFKSASRAMTSILEGDSCKERADLALGLCLSRFGINADEMPANAGDEEDANVPMQWGDAIASLCGLETCQVKLFLETPNCKNLPHARESFCQNAIQTILGSLHTRNESFEGWDSNMAEHRACGDWEFLLSEALLGSCADVDFPEQVDKSLSDDFRQSFHMALRWSRVQEACCSHLMPVVSLLRFGLSGGLGRQRHPLWKQVTEGEEDGNSSLPLALCEPLPESSPRSSHGQVNQDVAKALSAITLVPRNEHSDSANRPCAAVASNLVIDSKAFLHLESMEVLRLAFESIGKTRDLLGKLADTKGDRALSGSYVLEQLMGTVVNHGTLDLEESSPRLGGLHSFLGGQPFVLDTIAGKGIDCTAILSIRSAMDWQQVQNRALGEVIEALSSGEEWDVPLGTWSLVSVILGGLAGLEHIHASGSAKEDSSLSPRIVKALNEKGEPYFRTMAKWIICKPPDDPRPDATLNLEKISTDLCAFVAYAVGAAPTVGRKQSIDFKGGRVVLDALIETIDQWLWLEPQMSNNVMSILCLLGARYNSLHTIGALLLSIMKRGTASEEKDIVQPLERFFRFVRDLEAALSTSNETSSDSSPSTSLRMIENTQASREPLESGQLSVGIPATNAVPDACSYVLQSGFHQQYWYHCYTCNLVWDKGCCTLCALRCHQDHDVTYSRHSSFFCDCGGEAPTEEESRSPCKCLTSIESREAEELFEGQRWPVIEPLPEVLECANSDTSGEHVCDDELYTRAISVASTTIEKHSRSSVKKLKEEAESKSWMKSLFEAMRKAQELWQKKNKEQVRSESVDEVVSSIVAGTSADRAVVPSVRGRRGKVLKLKKLDHPALVPIRGARSSTFKLSLSSDSTLDRVKRAALAKHGVRRNAVVVDCRGRMIVAEPCSLLFCSALPSVNVRYEEKSSELPFARGQMSIIGSKSMNFSIVGMELCRDNERHLLVWGSAASEASVVVLSKSCHNVERTIELRFDLESDEVDYVIKCAWIPGSQTMVAVICGLSVKIFDLQQAEGDKVNSLTSYTLAYEACLRDVALVGTSPRSEESALSGTRVVTETVKLYMLLDIGQVLDLDLRFDENGLQEQGDMYIESGEGISLPVGGVRINPSSQPAAGGASIRSMGEGSSLTYLPESGVLLYSCLSSPVVALLLDESGSISGSFELLPYIVKGEVLGMGPEGYSIHGPFTRFTELGSVELDEVKYFRVACVGKSSLTGHPRILCLDFNDETVRVKQVAWNTAVSIPGLNSTSSFDGLAAFSAPSLANDVDANANLKRSDFVERAYLCAVGSNGTMALFGEELVGDVATALTTTTAGLSEKPKPSFPLTLFEKLVNMSDSEKLVFSGDRVGSATGPDSAKSKLSPNNSSYFMLPSREGSAITISLKKGNGQQVGLAEAVANEGTSPRLSLSKGVQDELVIVALRLLVGSTTTEFIPKYISVEGRRVWLQPDLKKHYDLPLTAEEIASALRNGFVTLGIGPSFDSGNNPLLDAVEVYAVRRAQISHWLPLALSEVYSVSQGRDAGTSETIMQIGTPPGENRLALSMATVTHLLQVLRISSTVTPEASEIIRQVIQATALFDGGAIRQSLSTVLGCIEADPCRCKAILDEGVLAGVLKELHSASEILTSTAADRWNRVKMTIKNCLRVSAAVAGERPANYKSVVESILANEAHGSSLAIEAASIVRTCLKDGFECQDLVADFIDLCLTESLLFLGRNEASKDSFASFDVLAELLGSSDDEIVNECCESILAYWTQNLSRPTEPVVSYQCDACSLFPIAGVRYTLPDSGSSPGQDTDIDLCSDCFCIGRDFAALHRYDSRVNVKIRGKAVGKNTKLSCAHLGQMKRIAIPSSWLVEIDRYASQDASEMDESPSGSADLENFSSVLFIDLVGLLSDRLEEEKLDFSLKAFQSLVDLILDLVRNSSDETVMLSRAKEFAESILNRFPRLIGVISSNDDLEEVSRNVLIICMQGLSRLVSVRSDLAGRRSVLNLDECSVEDITPTKSKEKTDPRFACEVHGVPAVRRRCSHGTHKNRRFYVCGMDRNSRCNYFKWADEGSTAPSEEPNCKYSGEVGQFIWELLNKSDGKTLSTCAQIRELVDLDTHDKSTGALSFMEGATGENSECSDSNGKEKIRTFPSRYDRRAAASDYADGVFCAKVKFQPDIAQDLLDDYSGKDEEGSLGKATIFTTALDLFSHVADASSERNGEQSEQEPSVWFPLLCEVSSTSKSPRYRALAKLALKRFCGGNREIYQRVRDHYVIAFQFRKLLGAVQPALQAGLNVKEQARQCGLNWRTGRKATFGELPAGGLIGTNDLISEDCVTVARSKTIGATLDHLSNVAKYRGGNWRNFCGLASLPTLTAKRDASSSGEGLANADVDAALFSVSPIISLLWIASVLSSENQIKILRLIDIAMSTPKSTQHSRKLSATARNTSAYIRESNMLSSDGRVDADTTKREEAFLRFCTPSSIPETILLESDKALLADEVHAFTVQFVIAGNSVELRKAAGQVARKLCQKFQGQDFEWLFTQLIDRALTELPELGNTCNELLRLLQSLSACGVEASSSSLLSISKKVVETFTSQLRLMSHGKSTDVGVQRGGKESDGISADLYDFTSCVHCQRTRNSQEATTAPQQQQNDSSLSRTSRVSRSTSTRETMGQELAMLPEQVRPFSRESLDASTDATLSTEFSTYVQLKCRLALSDIHVNIGDPRGRYVKTIAVYFSPRQVSEANVLKSDEYTDKWQRCATISLPRGATRASCSISPPIIAANLRIHYLEFYERPGGSRAEDGSLLLHCPRCTRVVSNAHGVCGHCGEVAFQCRKCRHINYLSLDAFLCVECGYCSAASFSYELTSGAASNAVAVVDDDSYERSIKVLRVATKLHEELRSALSERVRPSSGKRSLSVHKYGPALKRTFLGELPRISKEKKETSDGSSTQRSLVASGGLDESNSSTAGNRARSLLRLARQLRNDTSSERSRVGDLLMRQSLLGATGSAGMSIDDIDELDSDVVGFLSADTDGSDPLSRLVASIQGRSSRPSGVRDASSGVDGDGPSQPSAGGNENDQSGIGQTTEASSEECKRLYQLMREAERECHELRRRIKAWKRLENDALADLGSTDSVSSSFAPCQCSTCGGPLAQQLLSLFMALFESNTEVIQSAITQNFVQALFDESVTMHKGLFDAKRAAIVSLATKSESASKIILEQLRLRLKGSRDAASAEIMGKIIAVDSPLGEDYVKLASEILDSGY